MKLSQRFVNFKEGAKLTYDGVIYFPATLLPYTRQAKRLLGVDLDLGSVSAALSGTNFFRSKNLASCQLGINI